PSTLSLMLRRRWRVRSPRGSSRAPSRSISRRRSWRVCIIGNSDKQLPDCDLLELHVVGSAPACSKCLGTPTRTRDVADHVWTIGELLNTSLTTPQLRLFGTKLRAAQRV